MNARESRARKAKGRTFENDVADFVRQIFPRVERRRLRGSKDCGDLAGTGPFAVECKAHRSIDLASAVDQARVEAVNAKALFGVAVVKRRGKGVAQAYAVMALDDWLRLVDHTPFTERENV